MKVSVCGKGGSGKSTIVTLLANQARKRGYRVLVVDSDESNSGLFRTFGFDQPPVPLMKLVGGKSIRMETMFGEEKVIQGKVLEVDFENSKIIVEPFNKPALGGST